MHFLLAALAACNSAPTPPAVRSSPSANIGADGPTLRYLALGDSFTAGTGSGPELAFPAVAAQHSRCRFEVVNAARNGFTTEDVIARELGALANHPDVVTLAIGANDLVRGRTLEAYRDNVRAILAAIVAAGVAPARIVLLPQPDWARAPIAGEFGDRTALARSIAAMNDVLRAEGEKSGARWLAIEALLAEQAGRGEFAADGLHPNAAAYAAWAMALEPVLCPR